VIFDLHSHSTCSDGALTPRELVARAIDQQVGVLAITDHDTVEAFQAPLADTGVITLIHGVEFSTHWSNSGIHIVGLDIDPDSDAIREGVGFQTRARLERAQQIGLNLGKKGIENAFDGALALSVDGYVGRPQFARHLLDTGRVASLQQAFKKYLGAGKAGDVRQHWADLEQVIRWIRDANGIPVLAHPLKYRFTSTRLKRLLDAFISAGGLAMEVISGRQHAQQTAHMATLCESKGLLASYGSDFHGPGKFQAELGGCTPLPGKLTPVWERFQ